MTFKVPPLKQPLRLAGAPGAAPKLLLPDGSVAPRELTKAPPEKGIPAGTPVLLPNSIRVVGVPTLQSGVMIFLHFPNEAAPAIGLPAEAALQIGQKLVERATLAIEANAKAKTAPADPKAAEALQQAQAGKVGEA